MIRSLLTVSTGTLASRLLGFARDAMIAALLGAGPVADAFLVAFQLVNVVRRLLTEGALNAALVPAWLRIREAEGPSAAAAFAGRVLGTISAGLFAATLLLGLLMPSLMTGLAPGFAGHATLGLAVDDARLMLPYLAFAGPVTVLMGLMNAQARFALTAFSPVLFNIALIAMLATLLVWRLPAADAALLLAATVGLAGLLQLGILLWRRDGDGATPLRFAVDAEIRGFLGRAIPGMIANAGPQALIITGAIIASAEPAAVSWLYFANRLIELPLGIVGAAMGSVMVPELTRAVRGSDARAVAEAESSGLEWALGLALPATLGLIVLREPVVRMLFEHGLFSASDRVATASVLGWLALGLPAQVLVKALSPAFFARDDTRTPLAAVLLGLAAAVLLALLLGSLDGASGVATGIALGAWSSGLVLVLRGVATFGFSLDAAARRRLPRIIAAAAAMGGLLWLTAGFVLPLAATAATAVQAALLVVLIAGAIMVYGLLLALFRVVDLAGTVAAIKRTQASDLRD